MPRTMTVSDSVVVACDPQTVYDHVSNPAEMGRWSPENLGATLPGAWRKAEQGLEFAGHNKRGGFRWTTHCVVTAAEPGVRFAFRVRAIGLRKPVIKAPIASWEYRFEAVDGGTRVTEVWTDDRRWSDRFANFFDRIATRGQVFANFQRGNIRRTLRNLKSEMESRV